MTREELIDRANIIVENSITYGYCSFEVVAKDWAPAESGKSRTYFSIVEKSVDQKTSKHYASKKYGYLDNMTGEYVPDKYGDLTLNHNFGGNKF